MSALTPNKAFILAAGFGTRMRPLTLEVPKPLVQANGKSLLDRTIDRLEKTGITDIVINSHYLADKIDAYASTRTHPTIKISYEKEILDTGGGITKALSHFNNEAFYVLSGDGLWEDTPKAPALQTMATHWNPENMDILILLQPVASMKLTKGVGDYDIDKNGRAVRSLNQKGAYMFTSMRINHPRIFNGCPKGAFSYLKLLDEAQEKGRLYGVIHQGAWHHISTPKDLDRVDKALRKGNAT